MRGFSTFCATILFSTATCAAAQAEVFDFSLTGSQNAAFSIDAAIPPTSSSTSSLIGNSITYADVSGTFGGMLGEGEITFGQGPILADFNITGTPLGFVQFAGPTLFTGTITDPSFVTGMFDLTSIVSGNSTLTISAEPTQAAVPEPAALAIFATGLIGVGMISRRKSTGGAALPV